MGNPQALTRISLNYPQSKDALEKEVEVSQLNSRTALVCFDGLNADQFKLLAKDMPALSASLKSGGIAELDSSPFTDAQPIWAELLTGEPWYRNGCVGYAKPLRSLNQLQIFTERDLTAPIRLFSDSDDERQNILINTPLVQPLERHRIWLSDGSSPAVQLVSPLSLSKNQPFQNYNARPLVSMGDALANCSESLVLFINAELNRLQCAVTLARESNWKFLLYRTSIFDQLSHLLGTSFLQQNRLSITTHIKRTLAELDSGIAAIFELAEEKLLFSSFSHRPCKGLFSLNDLLEKKRLLARTENASKEQQLRMAALRAAQAGHEEAQPINVNKTQQFLPRKTLCASPIRGAVYLNTANRFDDGGNIDDRAISRERDRIADLLTAKCNLIGEVAKIYKNPETSSEGPNFVFQINGFELVESLESISRNYDLPLSTHCPTGFLWSPQIDNGKHLRSIDLANVIH